MEGWMLVFTIIMSIATAAAAVATITNIFYNAKLQKQQQQHDRNMHKLELKHLAVREVIKAINGCFDSDYETVWDRYYDIDIYALNLEKINEMIADAIKIDSTARIYGVSSIIEAVLSNYLQILLNLKEISTITIAQRNDENLRIIKLRHETSLELIKTLRNYLENYDE
ncbi:MAG: hypothetical protein FWE36_05495 [Erysipelotrichales bacterium]|nr:hypothetical protein [Erysipelotrichales bacterium]